MPKAAESERDLSTRRRLAPAVALFFLAPLIGEYLLGNVAIDAIFALFFLAPMYGGGGLLIREASRRTGRSWPTMFMLGIAYSLLEEAIVTQLLFNPSYHGLQLTGATIPSLGVSATQTINILTLHTVWSIAVPIALAESFVPARRTTPWLGRFGLAVTAITFIAGCGFIAISEYDESGFCASVLQLAYALAVVVAIAAAAFALPKRLQPQPGPPAPRPWLVLVAALVATSLFMAVTRLAGRLGVGSAGHRLGVGSRALGATSRLGRLGPTSVGRGGPADIRLECVSAATVGWHAWRSRFVREYRFRFSGRRSPVGCGASATA